MLPQPSVESGREFEDRRAATFGGNEEARFPTVDDVCEGTGDLFPHPGEKFNWQVTEETATRRISARAEFIYRRKFFF